MNGSESDRDPVVERALGGDLGTDPRAGYARFQVRAVDTPATRWYAPAGALAAAAAFACALVFTPLGGYGRSFLTIFQPQQFEPIDISSADLRRLRLFPDAGEIGSQRIAVRPRQARYASAATAQKHVAFRVRLPAALPAGFSSVRYAVISPSDVAFTFSAAKARAFARRSRRALPVMPAALNGTTVHVYGGSAFEARYANGSKDGKFLDVVEMQAPRVTSSGATLQVLERYVLRMPNISPALAARIRALGDNPATVPVPILLGKQHAMRIAVDGATGLGIGDNTGLGAGVVWQKNGIVYAVAGPLGMDDVLRVANGLR